MAWSWLQSASGQSGSGTTVSASFTTANLSSGSTLIAAVSGAGIGSSGTTSVKDGALNAFIEIGSVFLNNSTGNGQLSLWALNTPSGDVGTTPTITATAGASSTGYSILVQEVSGLVTAATSAAFTDGSAGTTFGGGAVGSFGPPTYSDNASNEYLVYLYGDTGSTTTWAAPSGYTADTNSVNSSGNADIVLSYKNSTSGTETGQYALSGNSSQWGMVMVAFKLSGGAAAVVPVPAIAMPGRAWQNRYRHQQKTKLSITYAFVPGLVAVSDTDASGATADGGEQAAAVFYAAPAAPGRSWLNRFASGRQKTRLVIPQFQPPLALSDTDTSGPEADAGESITASLSDTETSHGTDAGESIAATLSDTDTSGPELDGGEFAAAVFFDIPAVLPPSWLTAFRHTKRPVLPQFQPPVAPSDTDTSHGTDAGETITVTDTDASGPENDAGETVHVSDTDTSGPEADGGEQVQISSAPRANALVSPAWRIRFDPTRKLTTALPVSQPAHADADFSGPEADAGESITASLSDTETCHGTDAGESVSASLSDTDTSHETDAGEVIGLSAADTEGAAQDAGEAIAASLSDTDTSGPEADGGEFAYALVFAPPAFPGPSWRNRFIGFGRRLAIPLFWGLPSTTPVSDSDSCLGEDSEIDTLGPATDVSGTTLDTEALVAQPADTETCHGTESFGSLSGTFVASDTETCMGADSNGYQSGPFSDTDTGHGTDAEADTRTQADTETSTGTETQIIDVYTYVPLFRWTGGYFQAPAPVRVEATPQVEHRADVSLVVEAAIDVSVDITPKRGT